MPKNRPYLYYDHVVSLCDQCLRRIEGKQVIQEGQVWLYKVGPAKIKLRRRLPAQRPRAAAMFGPADRPRGRRWQWT